ncbi:hypothetical protein AUJ83_03285 [Candidatus Woesearchaeota archaeon CG1_02_33_12]|nr:MAG: hypothetical protein AUJ83_03285 [Candidatus Woesearchaeota archaeon CG1_02_33_12]PIU72905.1 MAG: 50S ribosomal protein L14e [Candidatus Woesearchaeota archaeon CG06_land_8_20_14_3_00_33_13]
MFEIGRLCLKIAGRDAGLKCIVVNTVDNNYVLIDGQTRRRKCNVKHLEPLDKVLKIKKGISHEDVVKELKKESIEVEVKVKRNKRGPRTEEKSAVKETVKKQEAPKPKTEEKPAAKPKEVKKPEAEPKKTVVKKAPVKKAVKEKVSKVKAKAKTSKK